MLLKQTTLGAIADGSVTLAFRRWKRPTVRAGGTLMTSIGQLAIDGVDRVDASSLTDGDARAAGLADRVALVKALGVREGTEIYRVTLRLAGPDPRIALRNERPDAEAIEKALGRLARWDRASSVGPWTRATLAIIERRPAVRAGDLAEELGMEKAQFKLNVRKLKGLGLTESLKTGYRVSPRGLAVRKALEGATAD